jgi:hypothetical protein
VRRCLSQDLPSHHHFFQCLFSRTLCFLSLISSPH